MKLGILGGTFNPPHNGHISAARNAQQALQLDKVLFIPTNLPPHKELPQGSATTQQRIDMVRLAVQELPFADVSTTEIERGGRSYTVDTVRQLKNRWMDVDIYIIMGTDMLLTMESWHMPRVLLGMCSIAVVARSEDDRDAITQAARTMREDWSAKIEVIDCPALEISSTEIRENMKREQLDKFVPEKVANYIKKHGLYK